MLIPSLNVALIIIFVIPEAAALWPRPHSMISGNQALRLSSNLTIAPTFDSVPQDLNSAISRTQSLLRMDKLQRLVVGRGSSDTLAVQSSKELTFLELSLATGSTESVLSITEEAQKPLSDRSEEYELSIPSDGSTATLSANTTLGLLRGLTTFSQLWYDLDGTTYTLNTPISIEDSPAFVSYFMLIFPMIGAN